MDSDDFAHAFGMSVECRLTKETANRRGDFTLPLANIEEDQAVARMCQAPIPEILIAGEEGRTLEPMENWKDVVITDAGLGDIWADLANGDPPFTQPPDFDFRDVFVDEKHAA